MPGQAEGLSPEAMPTRSPGLDRAGPGALPSSRVVVMGSGLFAIAKPRNDGAVPANHSRL